MYAFSATVKARCRQAPVRHNEKPPQHWYNPAATNPRCPVDIRKTWFDQDFTYHRWQANKKPEQNPQQKKTTRENETIRRTKQQQQNKNTQQGSGLSPLHTWLVATAIAAADDTSGDVALPLRTLIRLWVRASAHRSRVEKRKPSAKVGKLSIYCYD